MIVLIKKKRGFSITDNDGVAQKRSCGKKVGCTVQGRPARYTRDTADAEA